LQNEASPVKIAAELERILVEPGVREGMVEALREVRIRLGAPGASRRAAELLMETADLTG